MNSEPQSFIGKITRDMVRCGPKGVPRGHSRKIQKKQRWVYKKYFREMSKRMDQSPQIVNIEPAICDGIDYLRYFRADGSVLLECCYGVIEPSASTLQNFISGPLAEPYRE